MGCSFQLVKLYWYIAGLCASPIKLSLNAVITDAGVRCKRTTGASFPQKERGLAVVNEGEWANHYYSVTN